MGIWSKRNTEGWERDRRDLPKVTKTWTFEAPNFGNGARNGWSTRVMTKEVIQKQIFEPQRMTIETRVLEDKGGESIVIGFTIFPALSKKMPEFELMLLWALNILQENTGTSDVAESAISEDDYLETLSLSWEIFPPGSIDRLVRQLSTLDTKKDQKLRKSRIALPYSTNLNQKPFLRVKVSSAHTLARNFQITSLFLRI